MIGKKSVFTESELGAQQRWGKPGLWNQERVQRLIWDHIPEKYWERIEALSFFFLATSNSKGECDCSFKGGGAVRILNPKKLAFPDFNGNHAYMSLGNILDNPYVGMLFIDFNDGGRLRINGRATIHDQGAQLDLFPNTSRVVVVDIIQVVANCPAYIPRLVPVAETPTEENS